MMHYWLPASMLFRRELLRFWRERSRVAGFAGTPFVFWLVVGSGYSDFARFLPGALLLTVMFSAIFSAMSLIEDRKEGFLQCVLASPAPRIAIVAGKVAGGSLIATAQTLLFLLVASLGGRLYPGADLLLLALLFVVIAIGFTSAGFLIAWLVPSSQGFHAVINLLFVPLWMVSGAIFRLEEATTAMRWMMLANPVTYANQSVSLALGVLGHEGAVPGMAVSAAVATFAAVASLVAASYVIGRPSNRSL
jgi:ABC-2 type transport system permease protein